ncbi:MAG: hypothetical protein IK093_01175 [Ruminiclostridium sp.]|nr:hypothetical protein [Ruminiclostridium sp.]
MFRKFKNIIALAVCTAMLAGCNGSANPPATETSPVTASETVTETTTAAVTTTTAADTATETTPPSAAALDNEDEPDKDTEERPLTIAVSGVKGDYSPFDKADDYTSLMNKLTGVTLVGHTRAGSTVTNGRIPKSERYGGKSYTYNGIADTTVTRDEEEDTTSYTFVLRDDVRFADGKTMNADDIIFTLYLHIDPSYSGSCPLQDAGIVGVLNYRYNTSAADNVSREEMEEALKSDELKQIIKEQIMLPVLKEQYDNVKTMFDDSSYSVYTTKYPTPQELFAFFYALNIKDGKDGENKKYSAKGKDEATVISEIADMYDGNYRQLAGMTVGNETAFDEQALGIIVGYITGNETVTETVRSVSGIVKNSDTSVTVTVKGDCTLFEEALSEMIIVPLHRYGSMPMYSYENERYGFDRGKAASVLEKTRENPLGAGAFTVTGFEDGEVKLEANKYYYKGNVAAGSVRLIEGDPANAAQLVADGIADICASDGSSENYAAAEAANKSIEKIYPALCSDLGYGYIGINVDNVAIGDGFSNQSYALRKGLATAISAFRKESLEAYFGDSAQITDYPYIESLDMDKDTEGYTEPFASDVYGNPIYSEGMTAEERYEAVKKACVGFFLSAGYSMANYVITAPPYNGTMEFNAVIAANGTGDHPSYLALTKAAELLGEIGITLNVKDVEDPAMLWKELNDGTNEIWAGAWNHENLKEAYIDSYYGLEGSTKLKKFIDDAESASEDDRLAAFMKCYGKIVTEYAAEIPMYKRSKCTMFSTLRIDVSTVTENMTGTYDWTDELWRISPKTR